MFKRSGVESVADALSAFSGLLEKLNRGIKQIDQDVHDSFTSVIKAQDKHDAFIKAKDADLTNLLEAQNRAVTVANNVKKLLGLS